MKNILVTGGAGFIGSNFVRFILQTEPQVRVVSLDALTYAGSLENLKDLLDSERHTFVQGNICDRKLIDDLLRQYAIDTVVHFAAETHVDRSIVDPGPFVQTNIVGTYTLLEAARQYWLDQKALGGEPGSDGRVERKPPDNYRFHHVSTDEVYGSLGSGEPAWTESIPYSPNSPYAATKAASDHLVRAYFHTYGLPVTITNCTNNYGPHQFLEKLIPLMISNAVAGKPLPVYGDGQQIRDWLFVEDHCDAIRLVILRGRVGQTYNIGGGSQPTNLQVVEHLCAALDEVLPNSKYAPHRQLIQFVADRPGHDRRYAIDSTKISTELGWQPRCSLGSGLQKTVEWYITHQEWVEAIRKQGEYRLWMEKNYEQRK